MSFDTANPLNLKLRALLNKFDLSHNLIGHWAWYIL